jgi:NADPH-dependent curcumin reductase CurA
VSEAASIEAVEAESINRRILLIRRPDGAPSASDFEMESAPIPEPSAGQLLLRTLMLSLDPYMRGRMNETANYATPVALGALMLGATLSRVLKSHHPDYCEGELVVANSGWQDYAISDGNDLMKLPSGIAHPSHALGVLGMPGFAAYVGLLDIGAPQPGQTIVVAAATGAVGSVVGQIGKLKGCRVVGIAGGVEKCLYAVEQLGFDGCIDHHADDFDQKLAAACPYGIDIYFENVGGAVLDAVVPLLNLGARIPLCGLIAYANHTSGAFSGPDHAPALLRALLFKRARIQGFVISDHYQQRHAAFIEDMSAWVAQGRVKAKEDVIEGLQHAPGALMGLLRGDNFGKLLIKVAEF